MEKNLTKSFNEEKYKEKLEEKQKKLEAALAEAKKVSQYREIQAAVTAVDDILNKLNVFDKISSEEELNWVLPDLLASLGRYSMSDRAYIFTWASVEQQILHMTHEWCAEGISPTIGEMQELGKQLFRRTGKRKRRKHRRNIKYLMGRIFIRS